MDNTMAFKKAQQMAAAGGVKMIEGDDKVREKKCLAEVMAICQRYDCAMIPEVTIRPGQIQASVQITAIPRGRQETQNPG